MPARRASFTGFHSLIQARELGLTDARPSLRSTLGGLRTSPGDEYGFWNVNNNGAPEAVPPFTARFSTSALDGHALLTGDEEGILTVLDTRRSLRNQMRAPSPSDAPPARFSAHDNAIFDAIWLADDTRVASASGDGSIRVFDPNTITRTALCRCSSGSVKCVRSLSDASNRTSDSILVSCGRDGAIRLHDIRVPAIYDPSVSRDMFHSPVLTIERAHVPTPDAIRVPATKRRRVSAVPAADAQSISVTSVAVLPGHENVLFSSGAGDGTVKMWDLRGAQRRRRVGKLEAEAVESVTPSAERRFDATMSIRRCRGISCLDVDATGTRLLASSTDSTIYVYDAHELKLGYSHMLRGHSATSFYVRASFSPCGRFVASGSADSMGYIWELDGSDSASELPILQLDGHRGGEVSVAAWCNSDMLKVATCGDDTTAKVWTVQPGEMAEAAREEGDEVCHSARAVQVKTRHEKSAGGNRAVGYQGRKLRNSDIRSFFGNGSSGSDNFTCSRGSSRDSGGVGE